MKIVLFTVGFGGGGAERVFVDLANHWHSQGHRVQFWVINDRGPMRKRLAAEVPVHALPKGIRGVQRFTLPLRLRSLIRTESPDVIYSTLTYANCLLGAAVQGLATRPKIYLREANSLANLRKLGRLRYWAALRWMRRTYSQADAVIVNAADIAQDLTRVLAPPQALPVVLIPNPVVLESKGGGGLPVLQPQDGVQRILACGRLIPQKGFDCLLQALADLPPSIAWELVILGEGPERAALERLAQSLGIADRVQLAGFVDDVRAWMRGANLFVLSSRWEGFPNALVEAMACDTPVIATDCPGAVSEILAGELAKYRVPVDDRLALARKIEEVLKMPPPPKTIQAKIEQEYAFDVISRRYLDPASS